MSPICQTYESVVTHGRVAARGLADLLPKCATETQIADGSWSAGLGGAVVANAILYGVSVKTSKGERLVVLYMPDLAETSTVGIHTAAVCPHQKAGDHDFDPYEKSYFAMLASTQRRVPRRLARLHK